MHHFYNSSNSYETPLNHDGLNMTTLFQILNAFRGDKKTRPTASFSDFRRFRHGMSFFDNNIQISYGLRNDDLYDNNGEDPLLKFAVPDKSVSFIGPEVFVEKVIRYVTSIEKKDYGRE